MYSTYSQGNALADGSRPNPVIGQSLNNYEIKAEIGHGGMGTVYLAEHSFMGRKAAVKILKDSYLADESIVARFMNEARAANAIHHPNIIDIIDVGRLPDGRPYLMMEFLEGETLATRLSQGPLALTDTLQIIRQAAFALKATHDVGIVHRDLKPENIFLCPERDGASDVRVKVLDFGIAKLCGEFGGDTVQTTGAILGTPLYMSPEQCRSGAGSPIDHRTDIYALGAIGYEMLTGRAPFTSDVAIDIMLMHVTQKPANPRALNPAIPDKLAAVVLRALEKNPDARYASMTELQNALDEALPAPAPMSSPWSDADDPSSPRPTRWGWLLAGVMTAALVAMALIRPFSRSTPVAQPAAIAAPVTPTSVPAAGSPTLVTAPDSPTKAPQVLPSAVVDSRPGATGSANAAGDRAFEGPSGSTSGSIVTAPVTAPQESGKLTTRPGGANVSRPKRGRTVARPPGQSENAKPAPAGRVIKW
jgi:serine/threonine protein kinase